MIAKSLKKVINSEKVEFTSQRSFSVYDESWFLIMSYFYRIGLDYYFP